jgi:predicted amidohydrolase
MPPTLIVNGRVIDPSQGMDRVTNLLVNEGRIAAYDAAPTGQEDVIDASGKIVAPGLIDMHVQRYGGGAGRRVRLDRVHPQHRSADRHPGGG